jgi:hypothetical protein
MIHHCCNRAAAALVVGPGRLTTVTSSAMTSTVSSLSGQDEMKMNQPGEPGRVMAWMDTVAALEVCDPFALFDLAGHSRPESPT